jgi:hypothetical protein
MTRKQAPRGLLNSGKALWVNVTERYTLDPAESALLLQACRCLDNLDRISGDLAEMGVTVSGSTGQPRPNPLLHEQREQVRVFDQLQRSLALPLDGEANGVRRSADAKKAARAGRVRKTNAGQVNHLKEGA